MFKKMLSVLLVVLMLLSASVTFVSADETDDALADLILGDTDCDAEVNVKDATAIQKFLAGLSELTEEKILCADADYNGIVNIKDATVIQKYLAGVHSLPEGKFINDTFRVIDMKFELAEDNLANIKYGLSELIEYGKELTVGNKFEMDSYYRYTNADLRALSACRDKWPEPEDPLDVASAYVDLKLAIEGLVPPEEIPKVSPDDKIIEFNDENEFRIYPHSYGGENTNFFFDSLQDLKTFIETENMVEIPEEYDDVFFENNAIILSFFTVGGSGCEQDIEFVSVGTDTLTVHRTVTRPRIYPPDIDYRCTFIEVKKSDIEGVTKIVNDADYIIIGDYFVS